MSTTVSRAKRTDFIRRPAESWSVRVFSLLSAAMTVIEFSLIRMVGAAFSTSRLPTLVLSKYVNILTSSSANSLEEFPEVMMNRLLSMAVFVLHEDVHRFAVVEMHEAVVFGKCGKGAHSGEGC